MVFMLLLFRSGVVDLLRCVDPDDVQVAEVDALLVHEGGAGAALGPHVAPRGDGGGGGG